jgi:hypothetical protein
MATVLPAIQHMLEMLPVYDGESHKNFIYPISARVRNFSTWAMKYTRTETSGKVSQEFCRVGLCGSFTVRNLWRFVAAN